MTRSFSDEPVDEQLVNSLLDSARRVPSAGSSQGTDFLVLTAAEDRAKYWDTTLPESRRATFRWPGLLNAPLLVIVYSAVNRYLKRYSEPDKAATGLGESSAQWAVPYWIVDASFAAMALQLAAIDAGLGVLFFGLFDHEAALGDAFGVPVGRKAVGTLAIGHPDQNDSASRSSERSKRELDDVVHRGGW
jgi:nitroreductase